MKYQMNTELFLKTEITKGVFICNPAQFGGNYGGYCTPVLVFIPRDYQIPMFFSVFTLPLGVVAKF